MIDFAMENVLEHHLAGTVDLPANNPMSRRMCNNSLMVNIVNNSYRNHQIVFENMRNAVSGRNTTLGRYILQNMSFSILFNELGTSSRGGRWESHTPIEVSNQLAEIQSLLYEYCVHRHPEGARRLLGDTFRISKQISTSFLMPNVPSFTS